MPWTETLFADNTQDLLDGRVAACRLFNSVLEHALGSFRPGKIPQAIKGEGGIDNILADFFGHAHELKDAHAAPVACSAAVGAAFAAEKGLGNGKIGRNTEVIHLFPDGGSRL